jgi:magnesium-transporting ATPase (P-type)
LKKSFYKSLWLNFIYLLLGLGIAAIATWFTALYMKRHPSGSSEGSGWAGMADALSFGVMAVIYLVLALLYWIILIFRQSASHRNPLFYIGVHLLLLVLVVFIYISLLLQA